ncbi:MAG: phosphoadenosine phosphosulfate reductase family protein [Granulosicoccaceae bacterium]
MPLRQQIQKVSADLDAQGLLRYLITEKFPGDIVVTASLRASSIVVLKMVADIDPATPVIFCQRPPVFEESAQFREQITQLLGLENTSMNDGHEPQTRADDRDHCEDMWVSYLNRPGQTYEILHLNDCLAPYKCWVSGVYHVPPVSSIVPRVDSDGQIIKIDPLARWTKERVHRFMKEHNLPYHKLAKRTFEYEDRGDSQIAPTYPF